MRDEVKIGRDSMNAAQQNDLEREIFGWQALLSDDGEFPEHELGGDATGLVNGCDSNLEQVFGNSGFHSVGYEGVPPAHNSLGLTGVERKKPKLITKEVLKKIQEAISDRQVDRPNLDMLVSLFEGENGKPDDDYVEIDGDLNSTSCCPDGEVLNRTGKKLVELDLTKRQLVKDSRGKKDKSRIPADEEEAKRGELVRGRSARGNRRIDRWWTLAFDQERDAKTALSEGILITRLSVADVAVLDV